ncbi:MAG: hypothetical protein AAFP89_27380, partial [Bacteroidota bacterium]
TVDQTTILTESGINLTFNGGGATKSSSLLGLVESPSQAVTKFDSRLETSTPNSYSNTVGGEWLFADVPVMYDPCTCGYSLDQNGQLGPNVGELSVGGMLTQNSTFETVDPAGNSDSPYANNTNNGYGSTASTKEIVTENDPIKVIEKGTKFFKSITALTGAVNDQLSATSIVPSSGSDGSYKIKTTEPIKLPLWMKALPYVGDVFVLFDALVTGGEQGDKASTSNIATPTSVTFSGEINTTGSTLPVAFYTPGSEYDDPVYNPSPIAAKTPIYDYVLGTFNLLERPVLEYVTYQPYSKTPSNYPTTNINGQQTYKFLLPPVRQYRLKSIPKYVVNPASELELIGLDYAIQYKLGENAGNKSVNPSHCISQGGAAEEKLGLYGPVAVGRPLTTRWDNMSYYEQLRNYGISMAMWPNTSPNDISDITYTTDFFPASCSFDQSIFLAVPSSTVTGLEPDFTDYAYTPEIMLKVRAVLRRKDAHADNDTEDVIFMATYEVDVESIPGGGTYYISPNQPVPGDHAAGGCAPPTNLDEKFYTYMREYVVTEFTSSSGGQAFFPMGNNGIPFDLTFDNQLITRSHEALNSITINNSTIRR